MRHSPLFVLVALLVSLLVSGCTTSLKTYGERPVADGDAIVLVGIESEIEFSEARYCLIVCSAWYPLAGRKNVMAFPVRVGSNFEMNAIYTADNRVAPLKGGALKIEKPGVYYYGTIVSSQTKVGMLTTPQPRLLLAAKRKYGTRFDRLVTVNFAWPDPAGDAQLGFGYKESPAVQSALKKYDGKHVRVTSIAAPVIFDAGCRAGEALGLPDYYPYEEYIKRALNKELKSAKLHAENVADAEWTGSITELAFSTTRDAYWQIGLNVRTKDGRSASAKVKFPFDAPFSAAHACPAAEDAFPEAVQKVIEALVTSPDFAALMDINPQQ